MTLALGQVCILQKQFGKTAADLETLVEGFCWVLSPYSMEDILAALAKYVCRNNDIPAPADLANIIDPPSQPLSREVYQTIKQKLWENVFVSREEMEYKYRYEKQEFEKANRW